MKTMRNILPRESSPSFALISVLALVSLAALTATAFLASSRLERQASSSIGKTTLLDMALNSGKVCVTALINDYSQSDLGNTAITTYWRTNWTDELGYPFIAKIKTSGANNGSNSAMWYYLPLFSPAGLEKLGTNDIQNAMRFTNTHQGTFSSNMQTYMSSNNATKGFTNNPGWNHPKCVQIPLLGGRTSPPVAWVYIDQEKRKFGSNLTNTSPVVRIAWFTEDLEGLIDAERMGAITNRSTGTNPEEVSLSSATGTNGTALVSSISTFTNTSNRATYISFGLLASNSGLANLTNARYFASGLRAWAPTTPSASDGALAWIPVGIPISGSSNAPKGYTNQGYTKFNLNNLATNSGSQGQAVTNIAQIITSNLSTNFLSRAGGLTNSILYSTNDFDYAKCLAANIIDYIDADSIPTALDGADGYRGTEALPYCTEFALRIRIEDGLTTQCKDKTNDISIVPANSIRPSINAYLELWNPHATNIPLSTLGISFKSYGTNLPTSEEACVIGCNQFVKTIDEVASKYANGSSGSLSNLTFDFPTAIANNNVNPLTNTLASNAYCVIKLDHEHERLYPSPVSSNNWIKNGDYRFIYSGNTNDDRFLYTSKNTPRFSAACTNLPGSKEELDVAAADKCQDAVLELSTTNVGGTKIVYDRTRKILLNNNNIEIKDVANEGNNYSAFSLGLLAYAVGDNNLNTGDPRINYFLRQSNNRILCSAAAFLKSSFGGPNSNSTVPSTGSSFSTAPPTTCKVDITQWPDGGHNPTNYGVNPSGANPQRDTNNEPINRPIVATGSNKAPAFIRNARMTNILELGNIYDPILWRRVDKGNITINSIADPSFGGGNTLRIGRPEHPRFAFTNMYSNSTPWVPNMAQSAAALLDLFCLSNGISTTNSGPYGLGGGKINLNTAPAPVLRALAGGVLLTNDTAQLPANAAIPAGMAEAFAQGVMRFRSKYPFLTPAHLCFIGTDTNWPNTDSWPTNAVFGNTNTITLDTAPGNNVGGSTKINVNEWNDQAAEEWFSKIYALSSCQSHNFRIYVVAQQVATNSSGTNAIGPLVKKYYQVYFQNGSTITTGTTTISTYTNNIIYTWQPTGSSVDIYKSDY